MHNINYFASLGIFMCQGRGMQRYKIQSTKWYFLCTVQCEGCTVKSDSGTEQKDIHVHMCNVRLVRSATLQKQCSCVVVQCEAGPVKSKIKVKFMENLWLIV